MSLEEEIKKTLNNFEDSTSETILEIIDQIRPHFRSELTSEYLAGKIKKIQNDEDFEIIFPSIIGSLGIFMPRNF